MELYTAIETNERILSRYTIRANMEKSLPDLQVTQEFQEKRYEDVCDMMSLYYQNDRHKKQELCVCTEKAVHSDRCSGGILLLV